jgi:hypothetical protein
MNLSHCKTHQVYHIMIPIHHAFRHALTSIFIRLSVNVYFIMLPFIVMAHALQNSLQNTVKFALHNI